MATLQELTENDRRGYLKSLPTILRDIATVEECRFNFMSMPLAYHVTEAAAEIDRLRDNLNEAQRVLRAIATSPRELSAGYDHYAMCRETARMAADNIARVLTN